jgi:hypothetical protein
MLTKADVQEQLRQLAETAEQTVKALADGADPAGLDLAAGAVELDRLQSRLEKIVGRLSGTNDHDQRRRK